MGFGNTKLVCPKNYNKDKFTKLTKIYNFIDNDGNRVITSEEMTKFVRVYYDYDIIDKKNQIKDLHTKELQKIEETIKEKNNILLQYTEKCLKINKNNELTKNQKEDINILEIKYYISINKIKFDFSNERTKIAMKIKLYESLNNEELSIELVEEIGKKNFKEIEFKHFFNFLENRNVALLFENLFKV